jgi:hypothetical protein
LTTLDAGACLRRPSVELQLIRDVDGYGTMFPHGDELTPDGKENHSMVDSTSVVPAERIERVILLVRGQKVMLDRDLARLYGVTTTNLNKAVARNRDRFPEDFMFRLNREEFDNLKFHFGTSSWKKKLGKKLGTVGLLKNHRRNKSHHCFVFLLKVSRHKVDLFNNPTVTYLSECHDRIAYARMCWTHSFLYGN